MALIAICDINPKTLHKVGDQLGIPEEKRFTDWKEILRIEGLEAVLIVTPDQLHLEMSEPSRKRAPCDV